MQLEALAPDEPALGVGFVGAVQSNLAPAPTLGFGVALSLELPERGAWTPWFQWAVMSFDATTTPLGSSDVQARFRALLASASACPVRLATFGRGSIRPCVDPDLGRLTVSGRGVAVERAAEHHTAWLSAGISFRASLALWGPLELSCWIGPNLSLSRHEFVFAPDIEAFRVSALGWRGAAAGAVTF